MSRRHQTGCPTFGTVLSCLRWAGAPWHQPEGYRTFHQSIPQHPKRIHLGPPPHLVIPTEAKRSGGTPVFRLPLLACLLLTLPLHSQQPEEKSHPTGEQLFQTSGCTHCHQMNGQGGTKGPDLSAVGLRRKPPFIKNQIQQGSASMPAFQDALSEEEINALVLYLQNCRKKK